MLILIHINPDNKPDKEDASNRVVSAQTFPIHIHFGNRTTTSFSSISPLVQGRGQLTKSEKKKTQTIYRRITNIHDGVQMMWSQSLVVVSSHSILMFWHHHDNLPYPVWEQDHEPLRSHAPLHSYSCHLLVRKLTLRSYSKNTAEMFSDLPIVNYCSIEMYSTNSLKARNGMNIGSFLVLVYVDRRQMNEG